MAFRGPSEHVGTNSGLNIINSENLVDLVDPQMSDNQKHPPIGVRMAVYSNLNPFLSSGSTTFSGTASSATNSGTTSISYCYPPFPLLNNSLANVMASSGRSLMHSTTKKYISPIILNTSSISACPPSSFPASSFSGTSSTIACGRLATRSTTLKRKRECLTNLTAEQKLSRRKEKNRLAAQSCRDRKKVQQCNLELTVARLRTENVQLLAKEAKLRGELDAVKATRSLNTTCSNIS